MYHNFIFSIYLTRDIHSTKLVSLQCSLWQFGNTTSILSVKSSSGVAPAEIQEHHDLTTEDYYLSKGLRRRFPTVGSTFKQPLKSWKLKSLDKQNSKLNLYNSSSFHKYIVLYRTCSMLSHNVCFFLGLVLHKRLIWGKGIGKVDLKISNSGFEEPWLCTMNYYSGKYTTQS